MKVSEQLGFPYVKSELGAFHVEEGNDEFAITYLETFLREQNESAQWVRGMIVGARDPETGLAHLEDSIAQVSASNPSLVSELRPPYLALGFVDRHFEVIFEIGVSSNEWSDAEGLILDGTIDRRSGFTAHPRYLEVAEAFGLFDVWEQRGPPDYCKKLEGQWVCE